AKNRGFIYPGSEIYGGLAHHGHFAIRTTQKTKDYGADLIMRKGLHKIVVQAKRYDRNIGVYAIQQAMAAKAYYSADKAIVITNQYFTYSARKLAEVNDVQLVDRSDLFHMPRQNDQN
ncbi:MAG: restriction endonuclease, partial [Lactimicrobium massiliense]